MPTTCVNGYRYDADFYPFGGEHAYTNTCPQNYKFEGKERDTETGNDDFDARYYSNRFGRWLSADWSSVPAPVPYANLANPQTLNLYAMVSDDPESFADLDGHQQGDEDPEVDVRDDAELEKDVDKALSELAQRAVDANASAFAAAHPQGYDDPFPEQVGAACHLGPKNTPTTIGLADRTANDSVRRDPHERLIPDPEAQGAPHTQLGTRDSTTQPGTRYRQAVEYDKDDRPVRMTDFTDHGRPQDHTNPHYRDINPSTQQRGPNRNMLPSPPPPPQPKP